MCDSGDSDLLLDQIRTIDNKRFIKKMGAIDNQTSRLKIMEQLKIVLDLE